MAGLDSQVRRITEYVEELRGTGRRVAEFTCPTFSSAMTDGLPIRVGPGANPRIILRADTFVELGSPQAGSSASVLWTGTPALLTDGKITLIGPDIQEAQGATLPFGQVLLVGGQHLSAEAHPELTQAQYVADQIEGYMVRSSSHNIWSRVSNAAAAKGFSFETLGWALAAIFKTRVPAVERMEAIFITSAKEDVLRLEDLALEVRQIGKDIMKAHWKARGFDLDCAYDCSSCHDKPVCDDIRDMIGTVKKQTRTKAVGESK